MKELYISGSGELHTDLTPKQIATFELEEKRHKDTERLKFKEHLTEYLREIIANDIEQKEKISKYAPSLTTSSARLWAYVTPLDVMLDGTINDWKAGKGKVSFTGRVEICFT